MKLTIGHTTDTIKPNNLYFFKVHAGLIINKLKKLIKHNSRKAVKADKTIQLHYHVIFKEIKPN